MVQIGLVLVLSKSLDKQICSASLKPSNVSGLKQTHCRNIENDNILRFFFYILIVFT